MINFELNIDKIKVNNKIKNNSNKFNKNIIYNFTTLLDYIKKINKIETDPKTKQINKFRIRNLEHSLNVISNLDYNLTLNNIKDLNVPGIGKGTINRIIEVLNNNHLSELDDLREQASNKKIDIINELNDIINIGDKKAIELIKKFKIKSINDLKHKVDNGIIEVNDKIKMGLKYYGKYKTHIPRDEIDDMYLYINKLLDNYDKSFLFFICGSYRRGNSTSNDIDILLLHTDLLVQKDVNVTTYLLDVVNLLKKNNFIVDDLTDEGGTKYMGFCRLSKTHYIRRIDIRMIGLESFIPAIVYFTGSYDLNRRMRKLAKENGYKLNEYGLYDEKNKPILLNTEQQLFEQLGMDYLEPKERNI